MRVDEAAWAALLVDRDGVVSRADAFAHGWSSGAVAHRIGRFWQVILPGVLLTVTGTPTQRQRCRAALAWAGEHAALTAGTGLDPTAEGDVHVAVPHTRHLRTTAFLVGGGRVVPHRTTRVLVQSHGSLPCLPAARCVVDAAMGATSLKAVRALVSSAVQSGRTTVPLLEEELRHARRNGSAFLRQALEEVGAGARSLPEAVLLRALRKVQLPPYRLNVDVHDEHGRWLARPDVVIEELKLVVEVDGKRWHLDAQRWVADVERHTRLEAAGWTVLRYPATRVLADPGGVAQEIAAVAARLLRRRAS
jgi:very-short-patch-repair endonuclease